MASIPFFDSKECEFSDITVLVAGAKLTKLRGIAYKAMKDKELLHAAGDEPVSIQAGNRSYSGTIKLLKGALDDMNRAAKLAGGADALDLEFDLVVTYKAKGTRALQTDTLIGVQIQEFEKSMDQGSKFMEVSLPVIFLKMVSS